MERTMAMKLRRYERQRMQNTLRRGDVLNERALRMNRRYEGREDMPLDEVLELPFDRYCDRVLGIHVRAFESASRLETIAGFICTYVEQLSELLPDMRVSELADTLDGRKRTAMTGEIEQLAGILEDSFSALSTALYVKKVYKTFPSAMQMDFPVNNDSGITIWKDSLAIPLSSCLDKNGIIPEKELARQLRDMIGEQLDDIADRYDDFRHNYWKSI